ncbi:MAG: aminodeoxychorismate synthase component I [Victivallales bacterium]|nr:aminodeoxychorismate synthase component I [Victivallales bacterium]
MDIKKVNKEKAESSAEVVLFDAFTKRWIKFSNPVSIISTAYLDEVIKCIEDIELLVNRNNLFAAGFISYEASPAFDSALKVKSEKNFLPLLWFGLFESAQEFNFKPVDSLDSYFSRWDISVTKDDYDRAVAGVKHNIREGNTYQVNYTIRQFSDFKGDPFKLFCELVQTQKATYPVFIDTADFSICSVSPELFFLSDGSRLYSKPMKGTAARKYLLENDKLQSEWLHDSIKNRAENVMIVDMIRNDIGKIAETGSVKVPKLFEVEKYPTVWQMTSTVEAEINCGFKDVLKALFPCASITGAPKAETMRIISELESTPRGVYTGAAGFISPDRKTQFNVAIRTLSIDKRRGKAEFGVGGGIVWDSTDKSEFEECRIKTRFLEKRERHFYLLESLLWTAGEGYFLLDYHLRRVRRAAEYFDYEINVEKIGEGLEKITDNFTGSSYKVRLLVDSDGSVNYDFSLIRSGLNEISQRAAIADTPIDTDSPFVYYKTTNRAAYDFFREKYAEYDEVVLWNKRGEITESSVGNLVVKIDGNLFTPHLKSGLLPGTFREYLLSIGKIQERVITVNELKDAKDVYLINSVRKWVKLNVQSDN